MNVSRNPYICKRNSYHSMKRLLVLLLITLPTAIKADIAHLLPKPQIITRESGKKWVPYSTPHIQMVKAIPGVPINTNEAYRLTISNNAVIHIEAVTETGVYRAKQTLEQLKTTRKGKTAVEICSITDWPAFPLRGFMQDVGRTYISMDELKREIDLLSRFKINVFHWHLTENQAWRLESKIYPQLNAPQNMTRNPGKFYTQKEARELVEFCKERHVLLIPEIDMPGHSEAFTRTFKTDMQSKEGLQLLKQLMEEVCATFDVPYIHIGTDEVTFTNPQFVPEMLAFLHSKGKQVISWNPGWHYRPGEIAMTQLWSFRGKAQSGIPAIDSRFHYLNHFDLFNDLFTLYNSRIYDRPDSSTGIAGSILAVWNDRRIDDEQQIVRDNNLYANMLAIAERTWLGGGNCYFNGKGTLMWDDKKQENMAFADFENRMLSYKKTVFAGQPFPYVRQSNVRWRITDAFPNDGTLNRSFPPETGDSLSYHYKGKVYGSRTVSGAGIYLRHVWGKLVPGFYDDPQENHTAYATTWIYSPRKQAAGILLEFQNYSRSESDLPPRQGKWDNKGSRAWLNGNELLPPHWLNTQTERNNELPLRNENCTSRPPLPITLKKGWNKLFLKLPVGRFTTPEVRLVKWMFTAVIVTPDGQDALPGITYSANKP